MKIGERIKLRRTELGLSRQEVAEKIGYTNAAIIDKFENGEMDIPHSIIVQFAVILNVSVEYLMGLDIQSHITTHNQLGQKIKTARLARGMTQEALGRLLGVEKSAVAKYENGRVVNLKQATLRKLSEILDLPVSQMIASEEDFQDNSSLKTILGSHKSFSENLRFYITSSGRTQSEIADSLGIPLMIFNDWVKGKTYPEIDKLEMLAEYFGISQSDLIEERGNPEVESFRADSRAIFATNLRTLMAKSHKSRKDVSEAIGVSYSTFSEWCNGRKYPKIEKLEALATYFGVSVPELINSQATNDVPVIAVTEVPESVNPANTENQSNKAKGEVLDIILRLHTDAEFLEIVEKMSKLDNDKLKALQQFLKVFGG